ncbi:MAG: hypothetical protein PHN22_05100 [Candidatus ainarchaeum sp.]|nr:hypothetical protein [Candidatus ainarchaeum sp.]
MVTKYTLEFTIPRDLEIVPNAFKLNNKCPDFEVTLFIIKRLITIPGSDSKNTTSCFYSNKDRYGDTVKTRFKSEFIFQKDMFNDGLDEKKDNDSTKKYLTDWMTGKLHDFFYSNIVLLVNQIIETHQYVNNKYLCFL